MQSRWTVAALALVMMSAAVPAHACLMHAPLNLNDIQYADVVVVGRITNYQLVLDPEARRNYERLLASSPRMRQEMPDGFLSDYARFTVVVDEVLVGRPRRTLTVTWDNSTFSEPRSMPPGQFLIALRNPGSRIPPLRGPSATILPNREPSSLTVLQAPCAPAFIFQRGSEQARAIRRILNRRPTRPNVR